MPKYHLLLLSTILLSLLHFIAYCQEDYNDANYLTKHEKEILVELNYARTNPQEYVKKIQLILDEIKDKPNSELYYGTEGVNVLHETIAYLDTVKPAHRLKPSEGISHAAYDHAVDVETNDIKRGHKGSDGTMPWDRMERYAISSENLSEIAAFGPYEIEDIISGFIIDYNVPGRGHRKAIFDPGFNYTGIGFNRMKNNGYVCIIDLAGDYVDDPINAPYLGFTEDPVLAEMNYTEVKNLIQRKRKQLLNEYEFYESFDRKFEILNKAEHLLLESLTYHLNIFWYFRDNRWSFSKDIEIMDNSVPACRYHIASLFQDADFNLEWENLAKLPPDRFITRMVSSKHIDRYNNIDPKILLKILEEKEDAVYIIGFGEHVAFLEIDKNLSITTHADHGDSPLFSKREKADYCDEYLAHRDFIVGNLHEDTGLIINWLYGNQF